MYLRAAHAELHIPSLRQFIKANPLGILTTALSSPNFPLLQCSHIPWLIDVQDDASETELGNLRGHMARANPHSKAIIEAASGAAADADSSASDDAPASSSKKLTDEVMVLFNGPVQHYVTPKFYRATKPATGKVVPTWNYSAVQAYGTATVYFDSKAEDTGSYLAQQISDLSQYVETQVMQYERAWQTTDAPDSFIALMKKAIIGIEIKIHRLEGKFKMSQELLAEDRAGVIEGFEKLGTEYTDKIAETVRWREELKNQREQETK